MLDGSVLIAMVMATIIYEYVVYVKTNRNIMINDFNLCWTDHYANSLKYTTYLCALVVKACLTSVGLSLLVNPTTINDNININNSTITATVVELPLFTPLIAINVVILFGQCLAIGWCLMLFCCFSRYRQN